MDKEHFVDSNKFLFEKVKEYRQKEPDMNDPKHRVISLDCALLGWHACLEWLEAHDVDCHKAFEVEK